MKTFQELLTISGQLSEELKSIELTGSGLKLPKARE